MGMLGQGVVGEGVGRGNVSYSFFLHVWNPQANAPISSGTLFVFIKSKQLARVVHQERLQMEV